MRLQPRSGSPLIFPVSHRLSCSSPARARPNHLARRARAIRSTIRCGLAGCRLPHCIVGSSDGNLIAHEHGALLRKTAASVSGLGAWGAGEATFLSVLGPIRPQRADSARTQAQRGAHTVTVTCAQHAQTGTGTGTGNRRAGPHPHARHLSGDTHGTHAHARTTDGARKVSRGHTADGSTARSHRTHSSPLR